MQNAMSRKAAENSMRRIMRKVKQSVKGSTVEEGAEKPRRVLEATSAINVVRASHRKFPQTPRVRWKIRDVCRRPGTIIPVRELKDGNECRRRGSLGMMEFSHCHI